MQPIDSFQNEYRYLSNFWFAQTTNTFDAFDNIIYKTSEHAYQASKTMDINTRLSIARLATPGESKRVGRELKLREGWEIINRQVMLCIVRSKFENNMDLGVKLAQTKNAMIIEGNGWHDNFWGICSCARCQKFETGENWLGRILMHVRFEQQLKYGLEN